MPIVFEFGFPIAKQDDDNTRILNFAFGASFQEPVPHPPALWREGAVRGKIAIDSTLAQRLPRRGASYRIASTGGRHPAYRSKAPLHQQEWSNGVGGFGARLF